MSTPASPEPKPDPKFIAIFCSGIAAYARRMPVTQEWRCSRCEAVVKVTW